MPGGIAFKETMSGWFVLGATDPGAGAEAGRRAGTTLAMHAEVTIADIDAFVADRGHPGTLAGTIDFAPLGGTLAATRGLFALFVPAEAPRTKLMVYEMASAHQGKPRYLAGRKVVRNEPGVDVWSDTTTLYTTLHDGADKSGAILGAGVLRLGVADLMRLLSTVRRINGGDAATVAKFGRLFAGELWELYAPHVR